MALQSSIEWTQSTWNPVTGCDAISPGCDHCYAERMSKRLKAMGNHAYRNGFAVTLQEQALELPKKWKKPQTIFVNSMSDLFHDDIPDTYILEVFRVMAEAHWHQFQVLTKRAARLSKLDQKIDWPANVWMGVSVESAKFQFRIDRLRKTSAVTKFLSLEPLLGPLPNLNLEGIDWVIVGGESGPGARPMSPLWVSEIRDQCLTQEVPFFFKQWGGVQKKKTGRLLEGRTWDEMPLTSTINSPAHNSTAKKVSGL